MDSNSQTVTIEPLAPTISLAASGNINIHFHHALGGLHTVEIPHNINGMRLIMQILKARDKHETRIGELGNPTQAIIDAWLKSKKEQDMQAKQEQEAQSTIELLELF